jgi:hypothetical protein
MIALAIAVFFIVDAIFHAMHGQFWTATFLLIPPIIWTYLVEAQMRFRGRP